jgi:hypothetical protein
MPVKDQTSQRPTSLSELGYRVEHIRKAPDENGSQFLYRVRGPEPVYYIKRTKRGKLLAYKNMDDTLDVTIAGLYDFQDQDGKDLIGRRDPINPRGHTRQKPVQTTKQTHHSQTKQAA